MFERLYVVFLHSMNISCYEDFPQDFPKYEEKDINEVFQSLDLNKDGKLSLEEMMIGLTNEPLRKFSEKYVNVRNKEFDSDPESEDESDNLERPTSWHSEPEVENAREARKKELLIRKC